MGETKFNILAPEEIVGLKGVMIEIIPALPIHQRSCEIQAFLAEQLLKFAAAGERDPIKLKERALLALRTI